VLLLIGSCPTPIATEDLFRWTEYKNRGYFNTLLRKLHKQRFIELSPPDETSVEILPPGAKYVEGTLIPSRM
jgi:hypothetical protein